MSTIAVLGGSGFVGVNFARQAVERGHDVILIDNGDRMKRVAHSRLAVNPSVKRTHTVDLLTRDLGSVLDGATAIVNFAALAHVHHSVVQPEHVVNNNLGSTRRVIAAALERNLPLLFSSSIEVYGQNTNGLLREASPTNPVSPYGESKVRSERDVNVARAEHGLIATVIRFANLYGPYQAPDRIVPRLTTQLIGDHPAEVDGLRIRDYVYIDDAVRAILLIVEQGEWGHLFNISSGQGWTNQDVAHLLEQATGKSGAVQRREAAAGDGRGDSLIVDGSWLGQRTGWRPQRSFDNGLAETVDWYRSNQEWWRPFERSITTSRTDPSYMLDVALPIRPGDRYLGRGSDNSLADANLGGGTL